MDPASARGRSINKELKEERNNILLDVKMNVSEQSSVSSDQCLVYLEIRARHAVIYSAVHPLNNSTENCGDDVINSHSTTGVHSLRSHKVFCTSCEYLSRRGDHRLRLSISISGQAHQLHAHAKFRSVASTGMARDKFVFDPAL